MLTRGTGAEDGALASQSHSTEVFQRLPGSLGDLATSFAQKIRVLYCLYTDHQIPRARCIARRQVHHLPGFRADTGGESKISRELALSSSGRSSAEEYRQKTVNDPTVQTVLHLEQVLTISISVAGLATSQYYKCGADIHSGAATSKHLLFYNRQQLHPTTPSARPVYPTSDTHRLVQSRVRSCSCFPIPWEVVIS